MPTNQYFPGSTVSNTLPATDRGWDEAVYQSGKPVLDSELNLSQAIGQTLNGLLLNRTAPSGWLRGPSTFNPLNDFSFPATTDPAFVADAFYLARRTAFVAGIPIIVAYTGTPPAPTDVNLIQLDAAPLNGGAPPDVKRTDFVFLEVFKAVVATSPHATATAQVTASPSTATLTINGIPLTDAGGPRTPGADDYDGTLGTAAAIATDIAAAINDPLNSFTATCTAQVDVTLTDTVNLRAVVAGAAGNALTLATSSGDIVISGALFAGGANTPNKPTQSTIYWNGNVLANPATNLPDDIADPVIGVETTKRVQVQYRIRVTGQAEAVNFKTECDGFSNPNVLAQGTQVAPVALYPFVPADNSTVAGNSDATAYGTVDNGLSIAGDGSSGSATALGTADGFVYAIPIGFIFRRNDASGTGGFDPANNANGGLSQGHGAFNNTNLPGAPIAIPAGDSDRPDGLFHDVIVLNDLLDLRKEVSPGGVDLMAELNRQMQALLDSESRTWAIDGSDKNNIGSGSGTVGTRFLVCNEVGRSIANLGPGSLNGDLVAEFDHIRRRFASQSVVEKIAFAVLPTDTAVAEPGKYVTQANLGYAGWAEDDVITLDLTALNPTGLGDWSNASATLAGASVTGFWPTGSTITNVLRVIHDDGNSAASVSKVVQIKNVVGLGTPIVQITLDENVTQVDGGDPGNPQQDVVGSGAGDVGSQRRIFFEVEVSYPLGVGATDTPVEVPTPDTTVPTYSVGPLIEEFPAIPPTDYQVMLSPTFRESHREIGLEYVANDAAAAPISDTVVSDDPTTLAMVRRIYGSVATVPVVTDLIVPGVVAVAGTTPYGSSIRRINLAAPLSQPGQTLCQVDYYAQDPLPNWGGAGTCFQIAVYYNAAAPQTLGAVAPGPNLPDPVTVVPLAMARDLWTSTVSVGSPDVPFPYLNPTEKFPVNEDSNTSAGGTYPGDWIFCSTANISVGDFSAATGLLNLHTMVVADENSPFSFNTTAFDNEFRAHYKVADTSTYRPVAMAQPLSGPSVHKVWLPFLAYATNASVLWRKNEVLLIVLTRYAELDQNNTVQFIDTAPQTTSAAIYRTRGLLLLANQ
jgi:hypothetical protein